MCHLKMFITGKKCKNGYHDKNWSRQMELVGLMPMGENGKKTGYKMSHYIIEGGLFDIITRKFLESGFSITWNYRFYNGAITENIKNKVPIEILSKNNIIYDVKTESVIQPKKNGVRIKYVCNCEKPNAVWGREGLSLTCNICNCEFTPVE